MPAEVFALAVSLSFAAIVVRAMRRGGLEPRTSLLWLGSAFVGILISATLPFHWLGAIARAVGIVYPPDLLLAVAAAWLAVLLFDLSVSLSRLKLKQTVLAQELGLRSLDDGQDKSPGPE